jgi:uncharacterized DUF497 family protein
MEFDWSSPVFNTSVTPLQEIEEAFEDPFSIRLLPDDSAGGTSRYCLLGRALGGLGIFAVFRTDGKSYRVIAARPMSEEEEAFYERKNAEMAG